MTKKVLFLIGLIVSLQIKSQSSRVSLYEYFCGETCPPCASTAPGLFTLLSSPTNTTKIIAISWQTPIPSAPSNTWSLYKTNQIENDWRWKTVAAGGYGYIPSINSVPLGKIDGQSQIPFGATGDHPAYLNNAIISAAQSYTTPFSININQAWGTNFSSINVTVNINASSNFNATGNLVFRLVMIERQVHFTVQPGTNGEKDFDNVAVKSFPSLQYGTPMLSNWINGQSQTFTLNCALPSYIRNINEVAFVGFIQDDGDQKVWQTYLAEKMGVANDAELVSINIPNLICGSEFQPIALIKNSGNNPISYFTITPYIDGISQNPLSFTNNIAVGSTLSITLPTLSLITGAHTFSLNINNVSGNDLNTANNSKTKNIVITGNGQSSPISQGFAGIFPPQNWVITNQNNLSPTCTKVTSCGGYMNSYDCVRFDLTNYNSRVQNELTLPPIDLSGNAIPILTFDFAHSTDSVLYNTDTMKVYVSKDCGANWYRVYLKATSALSTTHDQTYYPFIAFKPAFWRTDTVRFPSFNSPSVLVKFSISGINSNMLYLDNINLSQSNAVGIKNQIHENDLIEIYPNPSNGQTSFKINIAKTDEFHFRLINSQGQIIYTQNYFLKTDANDFSIDTSPFANGIYQVIIETSSGRMVKKLCVSN